MLCKVTGSRSSLRVAVGNWPMNEDTAYVGSKSSCAGIYSIHWIDESIRTFRINSAQPEIRPSKMVTLCAAVFEK